MKKTTWYYLNAVVEIEPGKFHRAGFGRFLIPHPPVANWLLRRRLPKASYKILCTEHEMGHLQALPFEILYSTLFILIMINHSADTVSGWVWLVVSSFSVWEMIAEWHTIRYVQPGYNSLYSDISIIPRAVFWAICLFLTVGAWVYILA